MQRKGDTYPRDTRKIDASFFNYQLWLLDIHLGSSRSNILEIPAETGMVRTASAVSSPSMLSSVSGLLDALHIILAAKNNQVNTTSDGSKDYELDQFLA